MKTTPLTSVHESLRAKMVDFGGFYMPVQYTSIIEEHNAVRNKAGIFDVSHMGRIEFRGAGAETLLQRVCTRQLGDAQPGQSRYSHVCNEAGGILDDVIVSRYPDYWLMVCNASNRAVVLAISALKDDGMAQLEGVGAAIVAPTDDRPPRQPAWPGAGMAIVPLSLREKLCFS